MPFKSIKHFKQASFKPPSVTRYLEPAPRHHVFPPSLLVPTSGDSFTPSGRGGGNSPPPRLHRFDDSSVHYDSAKSLVSIGDGASAGAAIAMKTRLRQPKPTRERDPTVSQILENAGVRLERAVDQGYYIHRIKAPGHRFKPKRNLHEVRFARLNNE